MTLFRIKVDSIANLVKQKVVVFNAFFFISRISIPENLFMKVVIVFVFLLFNGIIYAEVNTFDLNSKKVSAVNQPANSNNIINNKKSAPDEIKTDSQSKENDKTDSKSPVVERKSSVILPGKAVNSGINKIKTEIPGAEEKVKSSNKTLNKKEIKGKSLIKSETERSGLKSSKTKGKPFLTVDKRKDIKKSGNKVRYENGLLDIADGNFKYERIPEISLPKDNKESIEEFENYERIEQIISSTEIKESSDSEDSKKGLFGFEKTTTDTLVKVLLVLIIIGVIILFKVRSKDRGGNVLRRFPRS